MFIITLQRATLPMSMINTHLLLKHDDVTNWKYFPRYWPFVRGIPVNSPHKGQWRGASMLSLICVWTNGWVYNRDTGDLIGHGAHYDVTVIFLLLLGIPPAILTAAIYSNNAMCGQASLGPGWASGNHQHRNHKYHFKGKPPMKNTMHSNLRNK